MVIPAALVSVALTGAACSSSNNDNNGATPGAGSGAPAGNTSGTDYSKLSGKMKGSGSTFQAPFIEEVAAKLEEVSDLQVDYAGGGSGQGKTDLQKQLKDFAGTDSLIKDDEKSLYQGGTVLYFPTVAAPVTVSYNVGGLTKLQLSPGTLAKIFDGRVKKWDDEAIRADNSGVTLPSGDIKVVRRTDGSGTTDSFTKYLKAAAPDFAVEPGSQPTWPTEFASASGNGGVATQIKSTDGAIGYVDYSDAKDSKLSFAGVKNKAGKFVEPSVEASVSALAAAKPKDNLTYSALNTDGADAYPIVAATYIIAYEKQTDAKKAELLKGFLTYILNEGQDLANDRNYAKLPADLRTKAIAQIAKIKAG